MHALLIPICIDMRRAWARSAIAGVRPHGKMSRRSSKTCAYRPRSGGSEASRGRRSAAHQGERLAHHDPLIAEDIKAYLDAQEQKSFLRVFTCGSVDDGKSTLIGRLLFDSKLIYEDQMAAIERDSKASGKIWPQEPQQPMLRFC